MYLGSLMVTRMGGFRIGEMGMQVGAVTPGLCMYGRRVRGSRVIRWSHVCTNPHVD